MNVLVTGSAGFTGKNIVENLKNFRDGKNRIRPNLIIDEVYEYDIHSTPEQLDEYCEKADWVINLAGVNRPKDKAELRAGNYGFTGTLLDLLKKYNNTCPVILSSSVQAALAGRFGESEYGKSKRESENLFFQYGMDTGAKVFIYRYPNLIGKWVRPNYNSAVGTFCYNIANELPITVNDRSIELELLFIDDLMDELWNTMEGHPHWCEYPREGEVVDGVEYDGLTPKALDSGRYCYVPTTYKATLGKIVDLLHKFHDEGTFVPNLSLNSFEKKLYSMYISYLPSSKTISDLKMNIDERGNFTELVHTQNAGQISVNVCKPGITRGMHWHNHKLERFIVVSGRARIRERRIDRKEIEEYIVTGEKFQSVIQKPGFVHEITNIGDTDLVTVMWANEIFDERYPDTFYETVEVVKMK